MAQGLWKGAVSYGLANVPVELFSSEKRSTVLDLNVDAGRNVEIPGFAGRAQIRPRFFARPAGIRWRLHPAPMIPQQGCPPGDARRYADELAHQPKRAREPRAA